ncbi:putative inactive peptidyl-prolyl cis-trans isomerase-like 6 isoform X2 [Nelusetta ayraudi]|uniref:putative inactive peptidyl-prolyl cis-trans isomerase-like 6 isoform X2 n=1 Tax=Nelusetta ayraudi TaxID=303726 RepID=UPI003F71BC63
MDSKRQLEIVGLITDHRLIVAKCVAEGLKREFPGAFEDPKIQPFLELDWDNYLSNKKKELSGEVWGYSSKLMCFLNGLLLGNEKDLCSWARTKWDFSFSQPEDFYMALSQDYYSKHLRNTGHDFVFMDIEIEGKAVGKLLFELFSDICPKTSENFKALCTGECGLSQRGFPLCYKSSLFHRVVPNGWLQGGDIYPERKGNAGESVYGKTFEDESFAVLHNKRGILGMANKGPHTNGSQFYITLQPTPWMDRTFVAFGQLVEGIDVLRIVEEIATFNERPIFECKVAECGVLEFKGPEIYTYSSCDI